MRLREPSLLCDARRASEGFVSTKEGLALRSTSTALLWKEWTWGMTGRSWRFHSICSIQARLMILDVELLVMPPCSISICNQRHTIWSRPSDCESIHPRSIPSCCSLAIPLRFRFRFHSFCHSTCHRRVLNSPCTQCFLQAANSLSSHARCPLPTAATPRSKRPI